MKNKGIKGKDLIVGKRYWLDSVKDVHAVVSDVTKSQVLFIDIMYIGTTIIEYLTSKDGTVRFSKYSIFYDYEN